MGIQRLGEITTLGLGLSPSIFNQLDNRPSERIQPCTQSNTIHPSSDKSGRAGLTVAVHRQYRKRYQFVPFSLSRVVSNTDSTITPSLGGTKAYGGYDVLDSDCDFGSD